MEPEQVKSLLETLKALTETIGQSTGDTADAQSQFSTGSSANKRPLEEDSIDEEANSTFVPTVKNEPTEEIQAIKMVKTRTFTEEEKEFLSQGFLMDPIENTFQLPDHMSGLLKGLPSVQAFLKGDPSKTLAKNRSEIHGIKIHSADKELQKLIEMVSIKIDFFSGIPPELHKYFRRPATEALTNFFTAKNILLQGLQLCFASHLAYSNEDTIKIQEISLRDFFLPMLNNLTLNLFNTIKALKASMLPSRVFSLKLHEKFPANNNFWNLSTDNLQELKKLRSQPHFNAAKKYRVAPALYRPSPTTYQKYQGQPFPATPGSSRGRSNATQTRPYKKRGSFTRNYSSRTDK